MEAKINSLDVHSVDNFINLSLDRFMSVEREATHSDPTVDILVTHLRTFAVTSESIVLDFSNGSIFVVNVPSFHYHSIEVL